MENKNHNDLAIQRFVEYIQIKTVQPEPDYNRAFQFLNKYAQELDLKYSVITIDNDRQAAILTVG
jgi:aminoacylase